MKRNNTSLKALLKRYANTDVIKNLEKNYSKKEVSSISVEDLYITKFLNKTKISNERIKDARKYLKQNIYPALIVRKVKDKYEVIVGRRSYCAALKERIHKLNCIVYAFSDEEALLVLASHIRDQRVTNVIEQAYVCNYLKTLCNYKNKDLALLFNQSESQISNILQLLSLSSKTINLISNGKISYGHAKAISRLPEEQIDNIIKQIIINNLSVRDVESLVSKNENETTYTVKDKTLIIKFKTNRDRDNFIKNNCN